MSKGRPKRVFLSHELCCSCKKILPRTLDFFGRNKNIADGLSNQCRRCSKEYRIKYSNKCKSHDLEYRRKYYSQNRDNINSLRRANYKNHIDECRKSAREKYSNNKEKFSEMNASYYEKNKYSIKLSQKSWRSKNKASINLRNRARALQIKMQGKISQSEIDQLIMTHDNRCFYCNIILTSSNLHLDHKIPLSRRGPHSIDNLVPACKNCNLKKGTKTDKEFLKQLEKRC